MYLYTIAGLGLASSLAALACEIFSPDELSKKPNKTFNKLEENINQNGLFLLLNGIEKIEYDNLKPKYMKYL